MFDCVLERDPIDCGDTQYFRNLKEKVCRKIHKERTKQNVKGETD